MAQATTSADLPAPSFVRTRLRSLRVKIALWLAVDALAWLAACLVLLVAFDLLVDWVCRMDKPQRGVMLILAAIVPLLVLYRRLVRPLSCRISDDALCLEIENRNERLGQSLISAVQFSRIDDAHRRGISPVLVDAVIAEGKRLAEDVRFGRILCMRKLRINLIVLLTMLGALGGIAAAVVWTEPMGVWFDRNVLLTDRMWPQDTYLVVHGVVDGKLTIPRGDDWPVVVTVKEESRRVPEEVYLEYRSASGSRLSEAMTRDADGRRFQTLFTNVVEPFKFRLRSGRVRTPWTQAVLVDRPAVGRLQLDVTLPKYAGGKTVPLEPGKSPCYILKGSRLSIRGTANKRLSRASLRIGERVRRMEIYDGTNFRVTLEPEEIDSEVCRIELTDTERLLLPGREEPGPLTSRRPTRFTLKVRPDREPQIKAKLVGVSNMVIPGARIPFVGRIQDDFQITGVRLRWKWRDQRSETPGETGVIPFSKLEDQVGRDEIPFDDALELAGPGESEASGPFSIAVPAGSGLSFHIEADDNDDVSGPKTGTSTTFLLRVVSEDELRTDLLRREKEQRRELQHLRKSQDDVMTDCRAFLAQTREQPEISAESRGLLLRLQKRQKLLGTSLAAIARQLERVILEVQNNRLEEENGPLQTRLRGRIIRPMWALADESVPRAAGLLDNTRRLVDDAAQRNKVLSDATRQQQAVLEAMDDILRHMAKAEGYQEAVNLLYQIQQSQRDVFDKTTKEKEERIRRLLEGKESEE